jgi:wobble nucleotide-excising tRNase
MSSDRYQPRDHQIVDLQADAGLMLVQQSTVFIGSKAADAAAAAAAVAQQQAQALADRAAAEMQQKLQREAAAAEQKRRDAEAIAKGATELNAVFDKALAHLGSGGAKSAANHIENVKELHELLEAVCGKCEELTRRVPQLKSVDKVVEPLLMRMLEAINRNREQGSPLWLDDATPTTRASFKKYCAH